MQSQDLTKLISDYAKEEFSPNIFQCAVYNNFAEIKEMAKKLSTPMSEEMKLSIRNDVLKYENLGKSRRWIRRYIKRKYNIIEY